MSAAAQERVVTSGTLERTPLSHLLVFLHEKRLTGTLEVAADEESAVVAVDDGKVTRVQTSRPVAYLGALLYEQGIIDAEELNASLAQMAIQRKLHGQVLLERGSLTPAALRGALEEQSLRKLTHILSFPKTALFSFRHDVDALPEYASDIPPLDPLPAIWRAAREAPPWDQVNAIVDRIGRQRVRLKKDAAISRFDFFADESAVVLTLGRRAMTLDEVAAVDGFGERRAKVLVYGLLIAKQVELLSADDQSRTPSSSQVPVAAPPSGELRDSVSERIAPATSGMVKAAGLSPPSTGRYAVATPFARSSTRIPARAPAEGHAEAPPKPYPAPEAVQSKAPPAAAEEETLAPSQSYVRRSSAPNLSAVSAPSQPSQPVRAAAMAPTAPPPSLTPPPRPAVVPAYSSGRMQAASVSHPPAVTPPHAADTIDDLRGLPVKTAFDGAKLCLSRGDLGRAERLCRRAELEERDRPEVVAMLAWLEALLPENQSIDATRRRIHMLDRAISREERCEQAYFWRGQLHKRLMNHGAALRDFRQVLELNSQHLDATREVRLYEMRIRQNSISIRAATPAGGTRRQTPTGLSAAKK